MKKITLSIFTIMAFVLATFSLQAQNREVVYSDDFESYAVGDYVAQSIPAWWTTWSNTPATTEDAKFSNDQAASGTKSIKVDGISDLVLKLGNKTSGAYSVDFEYFVPAGMGAYFNIQHFESPGVEWALEVYFKADGTGFMNAGGDNAATFSYAQDSWISVHNYIDLDADWAQVYFNDVLMHEWQFSLQAQGAAGTLQLGSANFYAGVVQGSGETPLYYIDDISFEANVEQSLYDNGFDSYTSGDYIAVVDPEWWTTWGNTPGTAEDAKILNEQSSSPQNSIKVDGTSDLVFKLGNKTSGKFLVNFNYYVPAGFGAYYNIQHFQNPGVEWALEVYFKTDGTGFMNAGGENATTFNYAHDQWIEVSNVVDLDTDWAEVYFNGVLMYEWQFSLQAQGQAGTLQLGAANFFAGVVTGSGETPTYYIDDVEYITMVAPALGPILDINTDDVVIGLHSGMTGGTSRTMNNSGDSPLVYDVVASFDQPGKVNSPAPWVSDTPMDRFIGTPVLAPHHVPGGDAPATRDVVLNYDGENNNAIGSASAGQWRVAAMFPASMVKQYNGTYLTAVDIFYKDLASANKIQIYDMGSINLPGPGALIYEQNFTPMMESWNHIVLTTPVYISGRDLWVGYKFNQIPDAYTAGVDVGPANPNGDWFATGPGWGHLSDNAALNYNWNIRAQLTGSGGPVWLSVNPNSGQVEGGASDDLAININTTGLTQSNYNGKVHLRSNDPENERVDINVLLTILTGVNEAGEQTYVTVYPNPAKEVLNFKGNTEIKSITMRNILGQVVYEGVVGQRETRIATNGYESGIYILTIQTQNGMATQKIVIQ